jgi:hypothetical protein
MGSFWLTDATAVVEFRRKLRKTWTQSNGTRNNGHIMDEESPLLGYHSRDESRASFLRRVFFDRKHTPGMDSGNLFVRWSARVFNVTKVTLLSSTYSSGREPLLSNSTNAAARSCEHPPLLCPYRPLCWYDGVGPYYRLHSELPGHHSPGCRTFFRYGRDIETAGGDAWRAVERYIWKCSRAYCAQLLSPTFNMSIH